MRRVEPMTARNSAGYDAPVGLTADPVVFTLAADRLSVLLARRLEEPQRGFFALPGGFVGMEETPAQTAERKLREKTGVGSVHLEQLRTYAEPGRDPRGWLPSVAYLALVRPETFPEEGVPAAREAGWFPVDALPDLALDHETISTTASGGCAPGWPRRPGSSGWRARSCPGSSRSARRSGSTRRCAATRSTRRTSAATSRRRPSWSTRARCTRTARAPGPGLPAALSGLRSGPAAN